MTAVLPEQVSLGSVEREGGMYKGSPSAPLDSSPHSSIGSNSSGSSGVVSLPNHHSTILTREYSDPASQDEHSERVRRGGGSCIRETSAPIPIQGQHAVSNSSQLEPMTTPPITDINELFTSAQQLHNRQFILTPGALTSEDNNGAYINWLYDLYAPTVASAPAGPKLDKVVMTENLSASVSPGGTPSMLTGPPLSAGVMTGKLDADFHHDQPTVFRAQEKYLITLGAPTSIAQKHGEDTLTYLNKGQFYSLYFRGNTSMSLSDTVKSVVYLSFFDEPDRRVEYNHWKYWYDLQANPNQRAFDVDRKNCEGMQHKPIDSAYNATAFLWNPEQGAKVTLRINCLSTEFSSQKGVKGLPLHVVVDTYEDVESMSEPSQRCYCKVKIFRDKGAERKNKDETKSVERRLQKFIKSHQGVSLDTEIGPSSVFHPPNKDTTFSSTTTFGPTPFLFILKTPAATPDTCTTTVSLSSPVVSTVPAAVGTSGLLMSPNKAAVSSLIASIRDRETKRTFSTTLTQTKEDLDQLEVVPKKKAARMHSKPITTIYVRKEEEKVYNALLLEALTVDDLKIQVSKKYDVPAEMIKNVFKRTKKGLIVRFDDEMVTHFEDEDDFLIVLEFDNQKGCFNLFIQY